MRLRDKLITLKMHRQDVSDGLLLHCLEEAAKDLLIHSSLAKTTHFTVAVAGTGTTAVSLASGDFLEFDEVLVAGIPGASSGSINVGTFDPSTGVVVITRSDLLTGPLTVATGTATSFESGYFLYSTGDNSTDTTRSDVDTIDSGFKTNDVVYSNGTTWSKVDTKQFNPIPLKCRSSDAYELQCLGNYGSPQAATTTGNVIEWHPRFKYDTPILVKCSYLPADPMDTIDIPLQAVSAIMHGAMYFAYMLPGKDQNLKMAAQREVMFETAKNNFRLLGRLGETGVSHIAKNSLF